MPDEELKINTEEADAEKPEYNPTKEQTARIKFVYN